MPILDGIPWQYSIVAVAFSSYYAYRGYMGNWIARSRENEKLPEKSRLSKFTIISIFCVHDLLFHFICSLAGFLTLFKANDFYQSLISSQSFDTGKSVLLVFSFLFGIVGVTGQLPHLILLGKLPSLKSQ